MITPESIAPRVCAALRAVVDESVADILPHHHLVDELGIDSVDIASLTIALEDEFDEILLLNEWIAGASDPTELTVDSLVRYIANILSEPG